MDRILMDGWDIGPLYFYSCVVLSFTEVAVLFASTITLVVLFIREAVRVMDHLLDVAISRCVAGKRTGKGADLFAKQIGARRFPKIVGAHNERF
jgi:hypothetical protein